MWGGDAARYINAAKAAGIVGGVGGGNYAPNATVTRAQAAKMLVKAFGLDVHTEKGPNFTDVPKNGEQWMYDAVETAYYWSITNGTSTSTFAPNDPVTRAQAAAFTVRARNPKVRSEFAAQEQASGGDETPTETPSETPEETAFGLSAVDALSDTEVKVTFTKAADETSAETIANYAIEGIEVTAAELDTTKKIVTLTTSAQTAGSNYKLVVSNIKSADDEALSDDDKEMAFVGYVVAASSNTLTVSISPSTPEEDRVPHNANGVPFLVFDLTAGNVEDVLVTKVTIERRGGGEDEDFDEVYLYDGAKRLTDGRKFSSDEHTATFNLYDPIEIDAGSSKAVTVVGKLAGSDDANNNVAGHDGEIWVSYKEDIVAIGKDSSGVVPVTGVFPVKGASMEYINVSAASIEVHSNGTANGTVKVGDEGETFGLFKLEADNADVLVTSLTVENKGTGSEDIENIVLRNDATGEDLVTVAALSARDQATFDLTSLADGGLYIKEGERALLSIKADVVGARSTNDKIDFQFDDETDILAIGQSYGFGANVDTSTLERSSLSNIAGGVSIESTDLVFDWKNPEQTDVAGDQSDVIMGILSITNRSEEILMEKMRLDFTAYAPNGTTPLTTYEYEGTNTRSLPDYIDRIELVNPKGDVVAGPVTPSVTDGGEYYVEFTDNWLIKTGLEAQDYVLRADLKNTNENGFTYQFGMSTHDDYFEAEGNVTRNAVDTDENVTPAPGNPDASIMNAKEITVETATLTVSRAQVPASHTGVAGDEIDVLGFTMKANSVGTIKVTKIPVKFYYDEEAPYFENEADLESANNSGSNVKLYLDDGTLLATESVQGTVGFNSFSKDLIVPAGGQIKLIVRVDTNSAVADNAQLYATVDTDGITALDGQRSAMEDAAINGINDTEINVGGTTVITLIESGDLKITVSDSTPDADQVVLGTQKISLLNIDLNSDNEAIDVRNIILALDGANQHKQISKLYLYDGDDMVGTGVEPKVGTDNIGTAEWEIPASTVTVAKDATKTLVVKADLNTSQKASGALAGTDGQFQVRLVEIETKGSENFVTPTFEDANYDGGVDVTVNEGAELTAAAPTITVADANSDGDADTGLVEIKVGSILQIEDEYMRVTAVNGNDLTVDRGINKSEAATHADTTAIAVYNIVSKLFIPYDTLPSINIGAEPNYPSNATVGYGVDVFGFTVGAIANLADDRKQKVQLESLRVKVEGSAAASGFVLKTVDGDDTVATGIGRHTENGRDYIYFDLSSAENSDRRISEATSATDDKNSQSYYIEADVYTSAATATDASKTLKVYIDELGTVSESGETFGDVAWSVLNGDDEAQDTSNALIVSRAINQVDSSIEPPNSITFTSGGGSAMSATTADIIAVDYYDTTDRKAIVYFDGGVDGTREGGTGANLTDLANTDFLYDADGAGATCSAVALDADSVTHTGGQSFAEVILPETTDGNQACVPTSGTSSIGPANNAIFVNVASGANGAAATNGVVIGTNAAVEVADNTAPTIDSVAITASDGVEVGGVFSANVGDTITATVTFDEAVTFTAGTTDTTLNFTADSGALTTADCVQAVPATATMTCTYTVVGGVTETTGLVIAADMTMGTAATIVDAAGNAATTTFAEVAQNTNYLIDTTAPLLGGATLTPADGGTMDAGDDITLQLAENGTLTGTGTLVITDDTDGDTTLTIDLSNISGAAVTLVNDTLTINPDADLETGEAYHITITGDAITDTAGNALAEISNTADWNFTIN
jgi:hypothetical protein